MVGNVLVMGIELTGSFGIGTIVGNAVAKVLPETLSTAEKVCAIVGMELIAVAGQRVVVREFEGYVNDLKTVVNEIKTSRAIAKAVKQEKKVKTVKVKTSKDTKKTKKAEEAK